MDIRAKPGTMVTFLGGASQSQINWGSHDDPKGCLIPGGQYVIARIEIRSWHTKVFLKEFPGKEFNGLWFG
ncbi:MAG: hypothetical protein V1685_07565 [Parcubacteria group bacterium]